MLKSFNIFNKKLTKLDERSKLLITTINAHCYNITQTDDYYREALLNSHVLIPDGISIIWAMRWLAGIKLKKIAGADLFFYEMKRLNESAGKCFFLGSSEATLSKIRDRAAIDFPSVKLATYSPPFRSEFDEKDNQAMLKAINDFCPDVLMVGMTAPKQEKWAYQFINELNTGHICCIGAVFDFYAGTIKRAPRWMISIGLEWLFRLVKEPKRMWRRYLLGNILFIASIFKEKLIK